MLTIPALNSDHQILSHITQQSKAHWGYSPEQLEKWREELTISPQYIEQNEVYKLEIDQEIIAYYAYIVLEDGLVELDNMFVLPDYIGQGYGKYLMNDFMERVKAAGFKTIRLYSEPHAEKFYRKLGFKVVGQFESSIKGRFLPIMERGIL